MDEEEPHTNSTDKCISGLIYKSAGGLFVGAAISFLVLKKRTWPMFLGTGIGTGAATSNCIHMFRNEDVSEPVGLGCDLPEMFAKTQEALGRNTE